MLFNFLLTRFSDNMTTKFNLVPNYRVWGITKKNKVKFKIQNEGSETLYVQIHGMYLLNDQVYSTVVAGTPSAAPNRAAFLTMSNQANINHSGQRWDQGFSIVVLVTPGATEVFVAGVCPVHCRKFSSISGLHPLDGSRLTLWLRALGQMATLQSNASWMVCVGARVVS